MKRSRPLQKSEKEESLRDSRNKLTKRRLCSSYSYFRAVCFLHHPGAVPRVTGVIFWISVVPTSAGRAACPCAPSFRDFPRHRCCGLIASFPGPCASSGGRLPEALFMVFQLDSKGASVCFFCIIFNTHFHYLIFNFGSFLPKDACVNRVDIVSIVY